MHGGAVEVWQGRVRDAIVAACGCPLETKDVWLTEKL